MGRASAHTIFADHFKGISRHRTLRTNTMTQMNVRQIKSRFLDALQRGSGEAYLLARKYKDIDFTNEFVRCSIRNCACDPQVEKSRAKYLYRIFKLLRNQDEIVRQILCFLRSDSLDANGLEQACDLAVLLFRDGRNEAADALRERVDNGCLPNHPICGTSQLIGIDGMEGLLRSAKTLGRFLLENPEEIEDSWEADQLQKRDKRLDVYDTLRQASLNDAGIEAYYKSIVQNKFRRRRVKLIDRFSYALIKQRFDQNRAAGIPESRVSDLTQDEVRQLASEYLQEKSKPKRQLYLRLFGILKFPFGYQTFLDEARKHSESGARQLHFLTQALRHFQSPDVRSFALERIQKSKNPQVYLPLFQQNYAPGDEHLFLNLLEKKRNRDTAHSIGSQVIDIYRLNNTPDCKAPLEWIYHKTNCAVCRVHTGEIMSDCNVLSEELRKEFQHDCYRF